MNRVVRSDATCVLTLCRGAVSEAGGARGERRGPQAVGHAALLHARLGRGEGPPLPPPSGTRQLRQRQQDVGEGARPKPRRPHGTWPSRGAEFLVGS